MKLASVSKGEASDKKRVSNLMEESTGGRVASSSFAADQAAVSPFSNELVDVPSDSSNEVAMPHSKFKQQVRARSAPSSWAVTPR